MNLHKHQLYLLENTAKSFKVKPAFIRNKSESRSLIVKSIPGW